VELVGLERDLRFTELSAALPRVERRGNVSVSLEQIASNAAAGTADVQLTLRYAAGGPTFESHRVGSLLADAVLVLPNGERRRNADAPALMREQDGTIGASYHFTNLPTDWRAGSLEYTVPAAMLRVPVSVAAMAPVQK
jgi:hypothetical protein